MNFGGIVLAGGKSSRMGKDKPLLPFKGKPLIEYSIRCLKPVCNEIIISTNNNRLSHIGYKTIADDIKLIGPIGGLLSGLKASCFHWNCVISCDTPNIPSSLFTHLQGFISHDISAIIPTHGNGRFEPLVGLYSKNMIADIERMVNEHKLKMIDLLQTVNTEFVAVNSALPFYHSDIFYNCNRPSDLK